MARSTRGSKGPGYKSTPIETWWASFYPGCIPVLRETRTDARKHGGKAVKCLLVPLKAKRKKQRC
jgi:hypothetical protein